MQGKNSGTARAVLLACTASICLGGCVAAAIPIAAGSVIGGKSVIDGGKNKGDARTGADGRVIIPANSQPAAISFDTQEPEDTAPDRMARAITIGATSGTGPSTQTTTTVLPPPASIAPAQPPAEDAAVAKSLVETPEPGSGPAGLAEAGSSTGAGAGTGAGPLASEAASDPAALVEHELAPIEAGAPSSSVSQAALPTKSMESMAPGTLPILDEGKSAPEGAPAAATAAPALPTGPSPYAEFINFAREQAGASPASPLRRSALLSDPGSLLPLKAKCPVGAPGAVLIDLDRAGGSEDAIADTRLATALASLRADGVAVLWISQRSAVDAGTLRTMLSESGLDPDGQDELLLTYGDQRKQTRRAEAAADYCILAIAGDERSDFDELYEYLRTPISAQALESMIGDGWFLVPPLLTESTRK